MQVIGRALLASVFVLGACAGGDKSSTKTDSTTVTSNTTTTAAPGATTGSSSMAATPDANGASGAAPAAAGAAPAAAAGAAPAGGAIAAAPATGKTVEVKMIGDEKGYRFEPSAITVKAGDAIKFTNITGGPHNVGFDPAKVPAAAQPQLAANMPGDHSMGALESPLLLQPNESYVISFAKVPAGSYDIHCTPHLALGMKGTVTVQ
jgi:plastocyanin